MKKNWLIPIGLTVLGISLAGRAAGAVTYARDGGESCPLNVLPWGP